MLIVKKISSASASLAFAKQLFQRTTDAFGPEEVEQGLGVSVAKDTVPELPFSESLLTRAKKLGFFLVFQADRNADGTLLTVEYLCECWRKRWPSLDGILERIEGCRGELFFSESVPRFGWRLVSRKLLNRTVGWELNYVQQSLVAASFLEELYSGERMPDEYARVIAELRGFVLMPKPLQKVLSQDAVKHYLSLSFTRHFRENPAEFLYRFLLVRAINQEPTLPGQYSLTNAQVCGTYIVAVGGDDTMVPHIEFCNPSYNKHLNYRLGLCLTLGELFPEKGAKTGIACDS